MVLPLVMFYAAIAHISISGRKAESITKEFGFSESLDQELSPSYR